MRLTHLLKVRERIFKGSEIHPKLKIPWLQKKEIMGLSENGITVSQIIRPLEEWACMFPG
jgi:hypothetical protein